MTDPNFDSLSQAVMTNVQGTSWDDAAATVNAILRSSLATPVEDVHLAEANRPS